MSLEPDDSDKTVETGPGFALPTEPAARELAGRYLLGEEIGRGGMAIVHLGRSLKPPVRLLAIKRLYPHLAFSPRFVAMFVDEARLAARVAHPNVIAPLDLVLGDGGADLYVVMDYVHGETLSHLLAPALRTTVPSVGVSVAVVAGALRGLHAVHEAAGPGGATEGLVHGDVSPQNVIVGVDGQPRVLDFGAARVRRQAPPSMAGSIVGKPAYLAPEQLRGEVADHRADLFAAGVMAWEALAHRRLFHDQDVREVRRKILAGDIPPLGIFNSAVPKAVEAAVLRALAPEPARRHDSALAFAEELEAAWAPSSAAEVGAWVRDNGGTALLRRSLLVEALTARKETATARKDVVGRAARWMRLGPATGLAALLATLVAWNAGHSARAISTTPPPARRATPALSVVRAPAARPATRPLAVPAAVALASSVSPSPLPASSAPRPPGEPGASAARTRFAEVIKRGLDAYDQGQLEEARRTLRAAVLTLERRGMRRHGLAAQAHAALGLVYIGGFDQRELAVEEFRAALAIDDTVRLEARFRTAPVLEAFREAQLTSAPTLTP